MTDEKDDTADTARETQASALAVQLAATPWSELEALEAHGYLHFPEVMLRKREGGTFEETPVAIRVPRPPEMRKARVAARAQAVQEGLDLDRDKDLVDDLENIHILAFAIRNISPPHEQWMPDVPSLEKLHDKASLGQLWAKLNALTEIIDPRPSDLSKEEVLAVIATIAKTREIYPLHALAAASQRSCIVTMANLSLTLLASKSSPTPSEPSTPGV